MSDHEEQHHEESSSGLGYKLPTAAGLLVLSCLCAYAPFWFNKFRASSFWQSVLNALAAGIFLSAAFIHILPEALESWEESPSASTQKFPWVFCISVCSFSLLLMVDRVLLNGHSHGHGSHDHNHSHAQHSTQGHQHAQIKKPSVSLEQEQPCCNAIACEAEAIQPSKEPLPDCMNPSCPVDHELAAVAVLTPPKSDRGFEGAQLIPEKPLAGRSAASEQVPKEAQANHVEAKPENLLGTVSVIFSMGLHATFEGLALGLMTDFSGFLGFLLAILFHKWAESMAIGVNILKNNLTFWHRIVAIGVFASLTPLGIVIGILASSSDVLTIATLLAIAAGTFLYIGIAEIISHEFEGQNHKWIKFLFFLAGNGIMILAWYFESLPEGGHAH